jgi:transposase
MPQERRVHTREFRQEAIQMVLVQHLSYSEVGRRLDVKPSLIRRWCLVYGPSGRVQESGPNQQTALETENRQLREENARLRMEREILKKATAFFAKESK